ncbi:tripartite tricarboxylate transporter substrate binding protein [Roseomonas sp. NAR14]|uniref:Tripartite tricarboxylate transporter substrate binding protein n=1 Tax=Roseomonas acroporae TaxID=2937791 RepID=A0A9X1YAB7_9PROT|nr:tripartite tricarboxylate transporter substrate binding protein [Roseomonas acroporae]MCK8785738.1 tripartite tricarboxylate transporter substrate binding protein [Roseomonas acroporae]
MQRRQLLAGIAAATLAAPAVRAQSGWPHEKPMRLICPFAPGAATDAMARLAAQKLGEKLGVSVVVENRAGGAAVVGTQAVYQAPADGYTLLGSSLTHTMLRHVLRSVPFDPQADFTPVARTGRTPLLMVMSPKRPEKSIAEITAAAKAKPADWTFAVSSLGAPGHLATIDYMHRTGVQIEATSYRGTAPALTDVAGGSAQLLIDATFALLQAARGGQVRPIGISTLQRFPLVPDMPTIVEAGLPGFEHYSWYGVWVRKGTPGEIVNRLNAILVEAMREPDVQERMRGLAIEAIAQSPAEIEQYIAREVAKNAELLRIANFQPE